MGTKFYNFESNSIPSSWCFAGNDAASVYGDVHQQAANALNDYETRGFTPAIAKPSTFNLTNAVRSQSDFAANRAWRRQVYDDLDIALANESEFSPMPISDQNCFQTQQQLDKECVQEVIGTASDGMTSVSYVLSCQYLDSLALEVVSNHCDDTVRGFLALFFANGIIGVAYIILLAVGLRAQQDWSAKSQQ